MKQYNLLEGRVENLFLRYLLPSVSGTLVTAIYILVDTIIVGKGIGAGAVAGLNIVLPMFSVFYGTGLLFGVGGAVLMSFSKGRGDAKKANAYFSAALLCAILFSAAYVALFQLFFDNITNFLGAAEQTAGYVSQYGRTIVWGAPLFLFSSFLQAFIRNDKAPGLAMAGTITGGVANIALDLIFVYVFDWGMFGAAFATVIGNAFGVIVLCSHFFSKRNSLKLDFSEVNLKIPIQIVKNGFSSFLIEMSAGIVTFLFNIQLMRYAGVAGVTAYSILSNTAIMLISLTNGVSQSAQPIIATNHGAGKTARVQKVKQMGLACSVFLGLTFTATAFLFPNFLINIFINPDEAVMAIALPAIRIYAVGFFFSALNLFLSNYFQAVLKPGFAMAVCLARGLILIILFVFTLPLALGVTGVWLTVPLTEFVAFIITLILLEKHSAQTKRIKPNPKK